MTLYERLERSLLVRSPWVVCISPAQARELGRLRRGRRAPLVIQNAVLAPRETGLSQEPAPSREELGFQWPHICVWRCRAASTAKRDIAFCWMLLPCCSKMLPGQPMELLLLGEGREENALRAQARRLGIEARVCFAGFQRRSAAWMKVMNCLVQPSLTDGTPNSVLEAMLLGIPVVATNTGGIPDVIDAGETGLAG